MTAFPISVPYAHDRAQRGTVDGPRALQRHLAHGPLGDRLPDHEFYAEPVSISPRAESARPHLERGADVGLPPIFFGGDHSITYELVRASLDQFGPLDLVVLDAHSDVQGNESEITPWNVIRRVHEDFSAQVAIVHVGFRDLDRIDLESRASTVLTQRDHLRRGHGQFIEDLRASLSGRPVYLSIDVDVLDPAYLGGVRAPIAGGLSTAECLDIINALQGCVAVADLVEFDHERRAHGDLLVLCELFGAIARAGGA